MRDMVKSLNSMINAELKRVNENNSKILKRAKGWLICIIVGFVVSLLSIGLQLAAVLLTNFCN